MNSLTLVKNIKHQKIGKLPLVVLPLGDYEKMKEDLEMFYSKKLPKEIKKAREEIKKGNTFTFNELKKRLKIV